MELQCHAATWCCAALLDVLEASTTTKKDTTSLLQHDLTVSRMRLKVTNAPQALPSDSDRLVQLQHASQLHRNGSTCTPWEESVGEQ